MRICSLRGCRLKHEWNQMVWSVNNLRCGTAATRAEPLECLPDSNELRVEPSLGVETKTPAFQLRKPGLPAIQEANLEHRATRRIY